MDHEEKLFRIYERHLVQQRLRWVRLFTAPLAPLVLWIMRRLLK